MRGFNIALIGKQYLRMLVDRGGFWFRMLSDHCGLGGWGWSRV